MSVDRRVPPWLGPALAVLGILGVLLAGSLWPVTDPRPLKMSCYWAGKAIVPLSAMIAAGGLAVLLSSGLEAARLGAAWAGSAAILQVLTVHLLIPYMPHSALHQRVHDTLAVLAIGVALLGVRLMRPGIDVDEALDAVAAAGEQPPA